MRPSFEVAVEMVVLLCVAAAARLSLDPPFRGEEGC
jgi:hypothetical protein